MTDADNEAISRGEMCCVCGRTDATIWRVATDNLLDGSEAFTDLRCTGCGTARLQPRPAVEAMGRYYNETTYARAEDEKSELGRRLDNFFARQADRAMEAIGDGILRGKMLDVGCGDGRFLSAMTGHGWQGEGIETDAIAASLARRRSGSVVHETPLEATNLAERSFDLISLLHVLEHVPNPRATLSTARRLLRPGGTLLLALPNAGSAEAALFRSLWYPLDLPRHYWGFTPRSLARLVEECGFVRPTLRYLPFFFVPQSLRYVLRTVRGKQSTTASLPSDDRRENEGRLQTKLFTAILTVSEHLGKHLPGEVMELTARVPEGVAGH